MVKVYFAYFSKNITDRPKLVGFCLLIALTVQTFTVQAQKDTTKLSEVKINADVLKKQYPTPSQQISNADFKKYAALTVADIASNLAGVNTKDYGGIGGLKTISVRSLGANHTGVLYDGVLLNDAQNGQIDIGKFNLYDIQSITLYNGQQPDIVQPARAFASASVLDIKTIRPQLTALKPYKILLGVNGGSFGLINPYIQYQQRVSSKWAYVINANYTGANGKYKYKVAGDGSDTLATRINSDVTSFQTDGALYWTKSDSNKFKLQFNYYTSDRGLPGPVIFYNPLSVQRLQNHDLLIQSSYEYVAPNSLHLLVNSKYSQNYLYYTDPSFLNATGGLNEHYTQHEFYQSVSVGYNLLPNWQVAYASDAALTNLFADVYTYAFPTRLALYNVFSSDVSLGRFKLQGSLLNNYIHDRVQSGTAAQSQSVFTPTIAASFNPFQRSGFQVRAFYKDVYRYPTFAEQYYYAIAPRNLKPERVKQYDLGATWQKTFNGLFSDVAFTADAYYNNIDNKIIYLPTRSPETPSVTNLGKVDIRGLDATFKTHLVPAKEWLVSVNATYTYQDAVDVTNPTDSYYLNQIPYTPKNLVTLNGGVSHKNLGLYYTLNTSSSRYYTSNNEPQYFLPAYSVSSASLIYSSQNKHYPYTASVEVNNLFNENYQVIRSYPLPGRSYRLSIQITI
ncbi:TonB-dependent receptor [Mucilaginibacter ginkgonis]|uniref:TonB-dependent receptor n=1 Tax=Mucilaginibacter ginkgonis TaxID=2682091 RepID=A0A6I4HX70_9SPHI|nr:TonB-dependent receptor [Mucilaginibacter ginkgonis]QQL51434.1 TonB-dependent receptor [Mucilaginibacter ginkgonis]